MGREIYMSKSLLNPSLPGFTLDAKGYYYTPHRKTPSARLHQRRQQSPVPPTAAHTTMPPERPSQRPHHHRAVPAAHPSLPQDQRQPFIQEGKNMTLMIIIARTRSASRRLPNCQFPIPAQAATPRVPLRCL